MDAECAYPALDYKSLFESGPGLLLVLTPTLEIVAATDEYLGATMTEREAIIGRGLFDVFPDNPSDTHATGSRNLRSSLEEVLRNRVAHAMAIQKYDIRVPGSERFEERFWCPINSPILNAEGEVTHIVHRADDVTKMVHLRNAEAERARAAKDLAAEASERKLAEDERDSFFTLSLDMHCIANADGFFKRVSPGFTTTLGWSAEELTDVPFTDFVHPDDLAATLREVERQVVSGEKVLRFENRYRHKDGTWRTLSWNSLPQPGGMMYATARDVTEQLHTAAALITAKDEAERANAAISEFLSHMSLALRPPLQSLIEAAQSMEESLGTQEAACIRQRGEQVLKLVEAMLDVARAQAA